MRIRAWSSDVGASDLKRKAAGAKVATINRDLTVLSGIAKHVCELEGWPEGNPVASLARKPRREKRMPYVRPPQTDIDAIFARSEEHTSELQSLKRNSYAGLCLQKKNNTNLSRPYHKRHK